MWIVDCERACGLSSHYPQLELIVKLTSFISVSFAQLQRIHCWFNDWEFIVDAVISNLLTARGETYVLL